jgi:hypothetical protein
MPKKRNTASEPILSSGAAPARPRKHAPAKRTATPVVETSPSTETMPSHSVVTEGPSFDEIAQLAYSYWEARGYQGGSSEEDWLRAEEQLRGQASAARA